MTMRVTIPCNGASCKVNPRARQAVETHWRFWPGKYPWHVCDKHVKWSRDQDDMDIEYDKHLKCRYDHLVQPVVGSEEALMVEIFMHAAMRLLRAAGAGR